jgi:hypothetical protein
MLLGDGELAVGLVHLGERGVAGRDVASVGGFVGAENVEKDRVTAGPSSREQKLKNNNQTS